jgi:hypothetical protein
MAHHGKHFTVPGDDIDLPTNDPEAIALMVNR